MRRTFSIPLAAFFLCAISPIRAHAYNEAVHASLTRRALADRGDWLKAQLVAPSESDFAGFRARFWTLASQTADPALRAEFLARFPSANALDAWSFKEFLMLNPAASVHGFDAAANESDRTRGDLLRLASRWPDDDKRNRNRLERNAQRQIVLDKTGAPLPYDPATLSLGAVTGPSSQGHAHYGLLPPPLSSDPEVLKNDPRHFAIPADAQSWGAQFAQLYTDLALVAHGSNLASRDWLTQVYAGAAFHHLEDVANQIHTIQVGIFEFFEAAYIQSLERDLVTLGGLFGPRASLRQLGLRLVSNHHLLLEDLFAKRVLEEEAGRPVAPELRRALEGLDQNDEAFAKPGRAAVEKARADPAGKGSIEALAYVLIDQSSLEGPECYRLIWNLSAPTLRDGLGWPYDGANGDDPDNFVIATGAASQVTLARFYALEASGVHRATTAVRLWEEAFAAESAAPGADQRAVDRILRLVLPYHREAALRRASYVPSVEESHIAWGFPLGTLALLLGAGLLYLRFSKRFASDRI